MSQNGINSCESLRKPTFHGATNGSPGKLRQGNERRNSKLMTYHYPDRGSASDWSCREGRRSTTQIWKVYVINLEIRNSFIRRHAFRGEISEGVVRCRLFPQATPAHEGALTCLLRFFQTCIFLENDFIGN